MSISITEELSSYISLALRDEGYVGEEVAVVLSDVADFQCNNIRRIAAKNKVDAVELAGKICDRLSRSYSVGGRIEFEVSGPGYINMTISFSSLELLINIPGISTPPKIGAGEIILIDFGGPNIAKPMHVGHLRSLVIGESLRRILDWTDHKVISDIHIGDWGLQMGLLLAALKDVPSDDLTIDLLETTYPVAAARAKVDSEFRALALMCTKLLQSGEPVLTARWLKFHELSMETVTRDVKDLGAHFDLYEGESGAQEFVPHVIEDLINSGLAVEDEGALIVPQAGKTPLIVQKSDGAALYATTDLATIAKRINRFDLDRIIYVTDERQKLHFEQVFKVAELMGYSLILEHVWFGTVNGPDGKPLKTRDGGVPKLHDLIEEATAKAAERNAESAKEVAIAALKFADLQNNRTSSYVFDLDKFLSFEGKTGPYLLYQAVRIKSIINKAPAELNPMTRIVLDDEETRKLAFKVRFGLNLAAQEAVEKLSPKEIADYVYDLCQSFSKFYTTHTIGDNPSRLALSIKVLTTINLCLKLLGIPVPERM